MQGHVLLGWGEQRSHFFLVLSSKYHTEVNANHTISMQIHPNKYTGQVKNCASKTNCNRTLVRIHHLLENKKLYIYPVMKTSLGKSTFFFFLLLLLHVLFWYFPGLVTFLQSAIIGLSKCKTAFERRERWAYFMAKFSQK